MQEVRNDTSNSQTNDLSKIINCVLIVDDDPILGKIIESFFASLNVATILTASDGVKALEHVERHGDKIEFILCDLNMPNMDGLQFLRGVSQRNYKGAIAILSGEDKSILSLAEKLATKHALNIVGALSKPLNYQDLKRIVFSIEKPKPDDLPKSDYNFGANELQEAIGRGEIIAHYQPQIEATSGKIAGTETLARWQHPEHGLIGPYDFIPLAEEVGLIEQLTSQIIDRTIEDAKRWQRLKYDLRKSINLSVISLRNVELPTELAGRIDAAGLERSGFVFEITESRLLEQDTVTMEVLARLRILGFELSIDDFGTGYSNIEHLRDYPFSELKIDRSFVGQALADEDARTIVEASVMLGKRLGLRVVAEGVETAADWKFVTGLGVDQVQGFYFAKPMAIDDLLKWFFDGHADIKAQAQSRRKSA